MDSDVTDMNTLTVSPWHLYSSHFQYILECLVLKSPTSLYRPYFNVKYFINFNIVLQFSGSWFLTTCILCLKYLWKHVVAIPCFIFLFYTYHIFYNIREQVPSPSLCSFVLLSNIVGPTSLSQRLHFLSSLAFL